MITTGVIRKIDELGRIVIPIEVRKKLGIAEKDSFEILVNDDGSILLKPYLPGDLFTGEIDNLVKYKGKFVSLNTIEELIALKAEHEESSKNDK